MATPTVRAVTLIDDESTTLTSTQTGTIPATTQPGDVLLLMIGQVTGTNVLTTPTGWTLLGGPERVDTNLTGYLFARKALAGDAGDPVSLAWDGTGVSVGVVAAIQDADTLAELITVANPLAAGGTSLAVASITTTEAGSAIARFMLGRVATGTALGFTAPAGHTLNATANTARGTSPNVTVSLATIAAPTVGAYSTGNWTADQTTSGAIGFSVALTPAPVVVVDTGLKPFALRGGAYVPLTQRRLSGGVYS